MPLFELQPSLVRRLADLPALLRHTTLGPPPLRSAPLHVLTSDDADEPRDAGGGGGRPDASYLEPSRSRPAYVERFLRRELGLSWARAEREVRRCRLLLGAGLPLMEENLAFLRERGVQLRHLQEDVDLLGAAPSESGGTAGREGGRNGGTARQ